MATVKDKFLVVYPDGEGGQVAYLPDYAEVKRAAYGMAWWIMQNGYGPYSMKFEGDYIKVEAAGLAAITYVVDKTTVEATA